MTMTKLPHFVVINSYTRLFDLFEPLWSERSPVYMTADRQADAPHFLRRSISYTVPKKFIVTSTLRQGWVRLRATLLICETLIRYWEPVVWTLHAFQKQRRWAVTLWLKFTVKPRLEGIVGVDPWCYKLCPSCIQARMMLFGQTVASISSIGSFPARPCRSLSTHHMDRNCVAKGRGQFVL
jgi:hypothetical protein